MRETRYSPSIALAQAARILPMDFRQRKRKPLLRRAGTGCFEVGCSGARLHSVAVVFLVLVYRSSSVRQDQALAELADLHVATMASGTPVDVVSTDRHTVKPWFQGKIPFTFNLPELGNHAVYA